MMIIYYVRFDDDSKHKLQTCTSEEKLNMIATSFSPFSIGTGRIGDFDKKIIYISVHNSVVLNSLYQQIHSTHQNEMHFTDNELSNSFLPHITLEKKLTLAQFQQGWNAIQHIETNYIFEVDSFCIFKHDGKKWLPDSTFKMKNQ